MGVEADKLWATPFTPAFGLLRPMRLLIALIATWLTSIAATSVAAEPGSVRCKLGGKDMVATIFLADFNYSAKGIKGATGKVSLFRLIANDDGPGETSGIDLKTVDVTTLGDYELSTESLWRSTVRVQGDDQRVTSGRFHLTRLEMKDSRGRAAGTVQFNTSKTNGVCSFDVEVKGINRGRLAG
jgi:hypothetical protein